MTDEFPRGATSTTKVGCRSYVHSEPPCRKGSKYQDCLSLALLNFAVPRLEGPSYVSWVCPRARLEWPSYVSLICPGARLEGPSYVSWVCPRARLEGPSYVSWVCPGARLEGPSYERGQPLAPATARLFIAGTIPPAVPEYSHRRISLLSHQHHHSLKGGNLF